jgi:hypothetical protein
MDNPSDTAQPSLISLFDRELHLITGSYLPFFQERYAFHPYTAFVAIHYFAGNGSKRRSKFVSHFSTVISLLNIFKVLNHS